MQWHNRYELREPVAAGSTTFHGLETSSGTAVLLHLQSASELLRTLAMLPPETSEHVRDVWEYKGALYIVTDEQTGDADLLAWIKQGGAKSEPAPQGEFTRVFQTIKETPNASAGEFTQLFQAKTEAGAQVEAPGEFTRFLASPQREQAPRLPVEAAPGDVTALFQRGPQRPVRPAPSILVSPPPPAPTGREIGDFTRLLGPSLPSATKPEAVPPVTGPAASAAPGEYTRVISSPPRTALPPAVKVQPPPPMPVRSRLAPILVFSGLGILALALILFVAIRQ
jgi:hypothetical protein